MSTYEDSRYRKCNLSQPVPTPSASDREKTVGPICQLAQCALQGAFGASFISKAQNYVEGLHLNSAVLGRGDGRL
jgi:hypothetical protein